MEPRRRRRHSAEEHSSPPPAHDESNWLVSYADMMTLLFGFFVLMYSFSRVDTEKFDIVRKELTQYFGGVLKEDARTIAMQKSIEEDLLKALQNIRHDDLLKDGLSERSISKNLFEIKPDEQGILLKFQSNVLFASGTANLRPEVMQLVADLGKNLKRYPLQKISVEGHTDDNPIASALFPSNWELSGARASSVVRGLVGSGLSEDIFESIGYAATRPEIANRNEKGEALTENQIKNRRVVIKVRLAPDQKTIESVRQKGFAVSIENNAQQEKVQELKAKDKDVDEIRQKLQAKEEEMRKVAERLKQAQELEKKNKEIENLNKKALDIEKKIETIQAKTQKILEKQEPERAPTSTGK